jgi:hypothetical protein
MKTEERIKELEERFQRELAELKKELKPELEVGKWYFAIHGTITWIVNPIRVTEGRIEEFYGTNDYSRWKDDGNTWGNVSACKEFRLATEQEVFEALKKEAIKYHKGCKIKPNNKIMENCNYYNGEDLTWNGKDLYFKNKTGYYVSLFRDGKWAEIIKEEPIMIGGLEVKRENKDYIIGCKNARRQFLLELQAFMINNNFEKVSFDGIETDLETINKIIKL